ncbi:hypothetical protein ABW21_db0204860 [Orbilia brochopaga]|nr:hypothetical protein ABW21_db0204860 [Drechslerella brochopaga]
MPLSLSTITFPNFSLSLPLRHRKHARIAAALTVISDVKSQLLFHAMLLQRHSPTLLVFLENFSPSDVRLRERWGRFHPYSKRHLQVLINVFAVNLMKTEHDESVLLNATSLRPGLLSYVLTDVEVDEALMRWEVDLRQRWIGRMILNSYSDKGKGMPDPGQSDCSIQEYLEMSARIWYEEIDRDYYNVFPEEKNSSHEGGKKKTNEGQDVRFLVQVDDDDETLKGDDDGEYKGPTCLRRTDNGKLKYKDFD